MQQRQLSMNPPRPMRADGLALVLALGLAGCTSVGQVTNLDEAGCGAAFERQLASILVSQHETAEVADELAERARGTLLSARLGPRPFLIAAPSGTDYSFIVEPEREACQLRLYARQKGFVRYSNNLTWIQSRALSGCACSE